MIAVAPVAQQITDAGNTVLIVASLALVAVLAGAYLGVMWEQRRAARPARGRRRADGPAVRGPRRLDRYRDNLRDDTDRLTQWVSARRRERAAAEFHARVLEERTGIPQGATR